MHPHSSTRSLRGALALVALQLAPLASADPAAGPATGPYRAVLASPGGDLPFGLELVAGDPPAATIVNGAERIAVPTTTWDGERLTLELPHYDARITATRDPATGRLDGAWTKRRGGGRTATLPFAAMPGDAPRFPALAACAPSAEPIDGRWRVDFESDEHDAVGVFETLPGGRARGTFLTTLGDYRYLAGAWCGDTLELSCFDGAHAFLFRAVRRPDGSLAGDFWSADRWHETWTAVRDEEAALPDPFGLSTWAADVRVDDLVFRGLDGAPRSLGGEGLAGRVRLVQLFGTWCPNCHDETRYLVELAEHYGDRVAIVGVAFEHGGDLERDAQQVRRFARHHGTTWPILVGGTSDKAEATAAVGALDRLRAYPTTLFVGADGRVRAVHTGFAGPATGAAHARLRAAFEARLDELVAEAARGAGR